MKALTAAATAAFLAAPGVAQATTYEVKLDGFCDIIGFTVETPYVAGISDASCDGGNFVGTVAKVKGAKTLSIVAAINYTDQKQGAYVLRLDYPIQTGGTWDIFYTKNGYRVSTGLNGTYTNWHDGAKSAPGPKLLDASKGK